MLQGRNLAHQSERAAVNHLVYSSVAAADLKTGIPHFESKLEIENYIRKIRTPPHNFPPPYSSWKTSWP